MKRDIVPLIRPATRLKMTGSGTKIFFILSGNPMEMKILQKKSFEDAAYSTVSGSTSSSTL